MKVLLVRPLLLNPLTVTRSMDCEPLELEYLAAACAAAFANWRIYDGIVEGRGFSRVVREFSPDVVAVTGYITQENRIRRYAQLAKAAHPGCRVVVGGVHAQLNYQRLYFPEVDYVLRGESMEAFQRLLRAIEGNGGWEAIPGLCYRDGTGFAETPPEVFDINRLPLPDRSHWQRHADRFRYLDFTRVATIKTAVSCPFTCTFCYGTNLHGGVYQARRLELVIEELKSIQADTVFIVDSDFLVEEERLWELARLLREHRIQKRYICYARADFIVRHPKLVAELCGVGFTYFLVGVEGVENSNLKAYHKQTDRDLNERCIQILQAQGAECVALMIADLSFRGPDFRRLYRWVKERGLRYVSVSVLTPIPPTPMYQREENRLIEHRPERWDLLHLVVPPEHGGRLGFYARYRLLLARLFLLGYRRGAYRFVTPRYLWDCLVQWIRRGKALR